MLRDSKGRFMRKVGGSHMKVCKCKCGKKPAKKIVNNVAFVIDESGSMSNLSHKVNELYNNKILQLREESRKSGQETNVTLTTFSNNANILFLNKHINNIPIYRQTTHGLTALCTAVCTTIDELWNKTTFKANEDLSFLVIVLTDGYENASLEEDKKRIHSLLEEKQALGNWTFVFMVPPGNKQYVNEILGVPSGNIQEWEQTEQGMDSVAETTTSGLSNYYAARSVGQTAVKNFCSVKVDLGAVKAQDLRKLDNIAYKCKILTVDKECSISDFVSSKRGYYVPGTAYYELTKVEKLNPDREILVMKKGENAIYGGQQARDLLGLAKDKYLRVSPYNMGPYNLYLESRSNNRILVRGTKVIVKT
jgi:uncharacterized protein YegL